MEKTIQLIKDSASLSPEQQVFLIAVLALAVAGFSLYVVLAALKNHNNNGGA